MKIRVAAVAGLTLAGLITGQAGANTKTCNLLQDDAGDAQFLGTLPTDDSLDILSADVASDAKTLTGAIRLKKLSATNPRSPGGQAYFLVFTVGGNTNPLYVSVSIPPVAAPPATSVAYGFGEYTTTAAGTGSYTSLGTATGVVDTDKNELRIHVPLTGWAGKGDVKPGATFKNLEVSSTSRFGVLVSTIDDAVGTRSYTAGSKSCVTVGV